MPDKKLLIIGAGPGGYVAAIRGARLGFEVSLIEKDKVGGVCLNVGCIPTKALLSATELGHDAKSASGMGVLADVKFDLEKLRAFKDSCVKKLTSGVEFLLKKNGVSLIKGEAVFTSPETISVSGTELRFDHAIVATGSSPIEIPGFPFDGKRIITSTEALDVSEIPERFLIIGAGVIGLEIASVYARLGSQVEIIEMMPGCLPGMDKDLTRTAEQELRKLGVKFNFSSLASACSESAKGLSVSFRCGDEPKLTEADRILVCVGRKPNSSGLGLEKAGVETDERGFIKVDEGLRTTNPKIFAIGDVIGGPLLAHKASAQGLQVVENLAGVSSGKRFRFIPGVVYTDPELASVGATEDDLRDKGIPIRVGKFPFAANGRAVAMGKTSGFVKIIAHAETDEILGAHMAGPHVSEMIAELALAMEAGIKAGQLGRVVHPHPTLSEAIMESAEDVHLAAVHIFRQG
ncbi:MAG: dihydrolipoyl dehydrogenase [candidate division WOR-3 bacterium]